MSVFHLKYRPQKISDLDLADVSERMRKILSAKEIPQAYLLAGPKGAGKTSAARILAKAVNCLKPDGVEPCGKCDNCKEINNGSSIDLVEIDAASNRGIEDVRALKDKAYLLPSKLKKKVFIIDEVHMLTREAFNALLKLIEEPPKNTLFIMCTTDAEKIPETVLSRLIRLDFRKGTGEEMKRSVMKIVEGEKVEVEKEALDYLLDRSDGSFRNIQKMFNEIYLELGRKIDLVGIKKYFVGRLGDYSAEEIERDLGWGKVKEILAKLEKLSGMGVDFRSLRERWMEYFQRKLLDFYSNTKKEGLSLEETVDWINLLIVAGRQEKEVSIDQLPLELAVVEFSKQRKRDGRGKEDQSLVLQTAEKKEVVKKEEAKLGGEIGQIEDEWQKVLAAVKPYNHSVEAFLRAARPKMLDGNVLVLEVFYPFHKEKLEEEKNRKIVEAGLSQVLGKSIVLECVLGESKKEVLVVKNETPIEEVVNSKDIYDMAKEIFG